MSQAIALSRKPHIVVATPGRLADHLENTKGFSLRSLRYLVMDEADRLLDLDFGPKIDQILKVIPRERNTFLFSAAMTTKVSKLQRASLIDPVKIEVASKYSTVATLLQEIFFFPLAHKDCYLVYFLNETACQSSIIFMRTVHDSSRLSVMLRSLGFPAIPLHGQMPQTKRFGALNRFKAGQRNILVATDVASRSVPQRNEPFYPLFLLRCDFSSYSPRVLRTIRGLDIPSVDIVINYDVPSSSKDYIHRVGRTARAGRSGKTVTLVTQYDVELIQRIEKDLGFKLQVGQLDK